MHYLQTSHQQDDSRENIRGSRETLEIIELGSYAARLVNLLLSEDTSGVDLEQMMVDRFDEMVAFHDEVISYFELAKFGAQRITDPVRWNRRLNNFLRSIFMVTSITLNKACTGHYYWHSSYSFNPTSNMIEVSESVGHSQRTACLCGSYRRGEVSTLSAPFATPSTYLSNDSSVVQWEIRGDEIIKSELSVYHVIPLRLISKFFDTWLSDNSTEISDPSFSGCLRILFGRLRRSMRKLFLVSVRRSSGFSINVDSNNFFSEAVERAHGMFSGNIFLGPSDRGPFSPTFGKSGDELLDAFEFSAKPIIGTRRYEQLLRMFEQLRHYVTLVPQWSPLARFVLGMRHFFALFMTFDKIRITPSTPDNGS